MKKVFFDKLLPRTILVSKSNLVKNQRNIIILFILGSNKFKSEFKDNMRDSKIHFILDTV